MNLTKSEPSILHHTFAIERRYAVSPERVFQAFSDPARKRRWFGEALTHITEAFEMDFRVGGAERARYRFKPDGPFPGVELGSDSVYLDIVPDRRIVIASTMMFAGRPMSASLFTFEFLPAEGGTDLLFTHQGAFFENSDGPEMRKAGWEKLFGALAQELAR